MKFLLITIGFVIVIIFLLDKLMTQLFNIFCKNREKHGGMIYNQKTKKLEADNSDINAL